MRVSNVKVIDASALAAIIFDEPDADRVVAAIRGCDLVAPALLGFEIANVCLVKIRRRSAPRDLLMQALAMSGLRIDTIAVDHHAVVPLAEATGLTTYDASYLWLAKQIGVPLVTLDRKLADAAERMA